MLWVWSGSSSVLGRSALPALAPPVVSSVSPVSFRSLPLCFAPVVLGDAELVPGLESAV